MIIQFEMHAYKGDDTGAIVADPDVTYHRARSDSAARSMAGRLSKKVNGPVDLAYAGFGSWDMRYITTASPSDFHSSGYRFERLA